MSTDLENDVAAALRFRADEVPDTSCPPLLAARVTTVRPKRWVVPVAAAAAAAAVAGLAAAAVVLLPGTDDDGQDQQVTTAAPAEVYYSRTLIESGGQITETELWQGQGRTDEWRQQAAGGTSIKDGRVVPDDSVQIDFREQGTCYPAEKAAEEACTRPGSWFNPTPDFLAGASRDATVIAQQLHDESVAEEERRTGPGGDFNRTDETFSPANLAYLQLNYLRGTLAANGMPADLTAVVRQVIAGLPDIEVTENMANLTGERGTGYSLFDFEGKPLTVIFDADGDYIGSPVEAVVHGMAPALGATPELFD